MNKSNPIFWSSSTRVTGLPRYNFYRAREHYYGALQRCRNLLHKPGCYSSIEMQSGGFQYTGNGDTSRCDTCGLEVSGWTSDMKPFTIHSQRSPTCAFVLSMLPSDKAVTSTTYNIPPVTTMLNDGEQPLKKLKTDAFNFHDEPKKLVEVESLKQARKRTFSNWIHRASPSRSQMIEAGFFNCNVGDRVICIYCNLICQQWTPYNDDPCEVHKTLSPKCLYVMTMLNDLNISPTLHTSKTTTDSDFGSILSRLNETAVRGEYFAPKKRRASFAKWPSENPPAVDELVKAGFFYTGTKTKVTCFYCNGSLQNWGAKDNPTIEHARWFPHCAYAKQLCGEELHRKIQESKKNQQETADANKSSNSLITQRLMISDEDNLSKMIAARLDLPVTKRLLNSNFRLTVIKRCWEDQLRLKREDFVSDCDLLIACTILQKQVEHINGKKENIIVPCIAMRKIRDQRTIEDVHSELQADHPQLTNPCFICLKEEKRLACIPCGHLATCVPCGYSLRTCPICQQKIEAFIHIYT